jgi:hypothetical protein
VSYHSLGADAGLTTGAGDAKALLTLFTTKANKVKETIECMDPALKDTQGRVTLKVLSDKSNSIRTTGREMLAKASQAWGTGSDFSFLFSTIKELTARQAWNDEVKPWLLNADKQLTQIAKDLEVLRQKHNLPCGQAAAYTQDIQEVIAKPGLGITGVFLLGGAVIGGLYFLRKYVDQKYPDYAYQTKPKGVR